MTFLPEDYFDQFVILSHFFHFVKKCFSTTTEIKQNFRELEKQRLCGFRPDHFRELRLAPTCCGKGKKKACELRKKRVY